MNHEGKTRLLRNAIIGVAVLAAIVVAAVFVLQSHKATADPFTATTRSSVSFPLYYPAVLPAHYQIDASSVTQPQSGVILFKLTGKSQPTIYFTEEQWSADIPISTFYGNLLNIKNPSTPFGQATAGDTADGKGRLASLIINKKTWVIANGPLAVPSAELQTLVTNLKLSQ